MREQIFADGIGEITLTGTILRIDLVSLSPTERDASNNPRQVLCQRIVMPVEGFANAFELLEQAMQRLLKDGLVEKRAPQRAAAASALVNSESEESAAAPRGGSPNFP